MYKTRLLKALSLIVCIVLIAAVALFTTGCSDKQDADITASISSESTTAKELGEGKTSFNFEVVDANGNLTSFVINTDEKTVGDALLKVGLIDGEDGLYGLYVKSVNSITYDYEKDGKYWAFYVDNEYAVEGVDLTEIDTSKTYCFKAE